MRDHTVNPQEKGLLGSEGKWRSRDQTRMLKVEKHVEVAVFAEANASHGA